MYTQNVSIPPDYFGDWRSNMPSQPEDGNSWNRNESVNGSEGKSKLYRSKGYIIIGGVVNLNIPPVLVERDYI